MSLKNILRPPDPDSSLWQYMVTDNYVDPLDQFDFLTDLTVRGKTALAEAGAHFFLSPASLPNQSTRVHGSAPRE